MNTTAITQEDITEFSNKLPMKRIIEHAGAVLFGPAPRSWEMTPQSSFTLMRASSLPYDGVKLELGLGTIAGNYQAIKDGEIMSFANKDGTRSLYIVLDRRFMDRDIPTGVARYLVALVQIGVEPC